MAVKEKRERQPKRATYAEFARAMWRIAREGVLFRARCKRPGCKMKHGRCMALTWGQLTIWMAAHDAEHREQQVPKVGVQRILVTE